MSGGTAQMTQTNKEIVEGTLNSIASPRVDNALTALSNLVDPEALISIDKSYSLEPSMAINVPDGMTCVLRLGVGDYILGQPKKLVYRDEAIGEIEGTRKFSIPPTDGRPFNAEHEKLHCDIHNAAIDQIINKLKGEG